MRLEAAAIGKPANAGGLLALALVEREIEPGERLFVLRDPTLLERAQPPGCTGKLRGQLRLGTLCDCVARGRLSGLAAGAGSDHRGGAAAER